MMCGRLTLFSERDEIAYFFNITNNFDSSISYNIAPSEQILAIIEHKKQRRAGSLRWGLIPPWAKDTSFSNKLINARGETIADKPSFRRAFKSQRCIIPANGFYEWKNKPSGKQPYFIHSKRDRLMAFAGLWERWVNPATGEKIFSCTIVTTEANETIQPLHQRMPVILNEEAQSIWLDCDNYNEQQLKTIITTKYPEDKLTAYRVSTFVNHPSNDDKKCIIKA